MNRLLVVAFGLLTVHVAASQDYPFPPQASESTCSFGFNDDNVRLDCSPEAGATEENCINRGCCWRTTTLGHPFCYYPENFLAFDAVNDTHLRRVYRSQFPGDVNHLKLEVIEPEDNHVFVRLTDAENQRFEPPYPKLNQIKKPAEAAIPYEISYQTDGALMQVNRNGNRLFAVQNANVIYADQFLQLTFLLSGNPTLYGIGEHRAGWALDQNWTKWTLWNHDVGPRESTNLYGSHPFILAVDEQGNASGLYFHNSNAAEFLIQPGPRVTYRTIGGIIQFHYFPGPSPADVVSQYSQLVGLPAMPPYWGLGFQLCSSVGSYDHKKLELLDLGTRYMFTVGRFETYCTWTMILREGNLYGYNSTDNTRAVWQRMRDAKIPFDVQWNDIDYMEHHNDFTIDPVNFAELPQLVDDIHAAGMHYVAMLDPGVSGSEPEGTYPPYSDGVAMDTFVKDASGNIFIGHVWNDADTVFPDFFHPRAVEYWTKQLREFHEKIKYDALWLDMNEPSNFFDGTANGCPDNNIENPPYAPPVDGKLQTRTLCLTAQHAAGKHYDLHNLFAISQADVTKQAAEDILGKRTFIVSRASFSGQSRYSGHWAGDNNSAWSEMVASIAELLNFSIFGVPLMGSDICGYGGEANKELCNRWMQLGAFYPFSRNHNAIESKDQDPASFDAEFVKSVRRALYARYALLPYLYTLFYEAQVSGTTVARPLLFEFPTDKNVRNLDRAFMWGSGLYIIPVLEEGATEVVAYIPEARWFDYYNGEELKGRGNVTLSAPFDTIPLFVRGGNILPAQAPDVTTTLSRKNPLAILAAPDTDGNASGSLFWDDGESLNTIENNEFGLLKMELSGNTFKTTVTQWKTPDTPIVLYVGVFGVGTVSNVTVNGEPAEFNVSNQLLTVALPWIPVNEPIEIVWS